MTELLNSRRQRCRFWSVQFARPIIANTGIRERSGSPTLPNIGPPLFGAQVARPDDGQRAHASARTSSDMTIAVCVTTSLASSQSVCSPSLARPVFEPLHEIAHGAPVDQHHVVELGVRLRQRAAAAWRGPARIRSTVFDGPEVTAWPCSAQNAHGERLHRFAAHVPDLGHPVSPQSRSRHSIASASAHRANAEAEYGPASGTGSSRRRTSASIRSTPVSCCASQ